MNTLDEYFDLAKESAKPLTQDILDKCITTKTYFGGDFEVGDKILFALCENNLGSHDLFYFSDKELNNLRSLFDFVGFTDEEEYKSVIPIFKKK